MFKYMIFILLISACNKSIKPDLSKIKSYNFNLESEWSCPPPYLIELSNRNKKLWYLGARHENSENSSSFKLIDNFFDSYTPDLVIIEGIEFAYGLSPTKILSIIDENCSKNKIKNDKSSCNESLYTAMNADKKNIPFVGAEPRDKVQLNYFIKNGYTEEDYANFWFTHVISQLYRQGEINSINDLEKKYMPFINLFVNIVNPSNYNYTKYQIWLYKNLPGVKFEDLIDSNFSAPIKSGNYLQKLSSLSEYIRDRHILSTIYKYVNKYDNVLVVYGHSHFLTQKDALEKSFSEYKLLN